MGRKVDVQLKISNRSIGFRSYQQRFFAEHPEFKPDIFCRSAIDEQIKIIDPDFLPEVK